MRVAAIDDIHGNLPALEAVIPEIRRAGVDRVVVGGDVVSGLSPCETLPNAAGHRGTSRGRPPRPGCWRCSMNRRSEGSSTTFPKSSITW
jgi:hypothetical protein